MRTFNGLLFCLIIIFSVNSYAADDNFSWDSFKQKAKDTLVEWKALAEAKWKVWTGSESTEKVVESIAPPISMSEPQVTQQNERTPASSALAPLQTERNNYQTVLEQTRQTVKSKGAWTESGGREADASLTKTKAGVPYMKKEIVLKIKDVPRLNVGEEKTISKNDLIPESLKITVHKVEKMKKLDTPALLSAKDLQLWTQGKYPVVPPWREPKDSQYGVGKVVTSQKIEKVDVQMTPEKVLEALRSLEKMTAEDLKMLNALLMLKKGDKCHIASGLLHDLSNSEVYKEEANYHLGVCAHQMGIHSEAVSRLLRVIRSENQDYAAEAIKNIIEDLPAEYAVEVAQAIRSMKNQDLVPTSAKELLNFVFARAAHQKDRYEEAHIYAGKVTEASPVYAKARYLYAIGLYGDRQITKAQKTLEELRGWLAKNKAVDKSLDALITINLARIYFIQEKYQTAYQEYMKTPKDHPLWVQALIEQGWAQLSIGDAEGAIGNMYSLHSPYFKSVFMPDSWVVRTVGYIDICQYGDAYKTLSKLEQIHGAHYRDVQKYRATRKDGDLYYQTVRNYLKGRSDQVVDGLSPQVIREVARKREFLNVQEALNSKEDEKSQLAFIQELISKDLASLKSRLSKSKERRALHAANLNKIKVQPELAKNEFEWKTSLKAEEALIRNLTFEIEVHADARKGFTRMKDVVLSRIEKDKSKLKVAAGTALMKHMREVEQDLARIIESNEFLRYEVFAGSGENIRYQVAGGATETARKVPANVKPEKLQNWDFDGEYWEDEIGSYRSSLRNNCPNKRRTTAKVEGE